jgi:hypothetical protein
MLSKKVIPMKVILLAVLYTRDFNHFKDTKDEVFLSFSFRNERPFLARTLGLPNGVNPYPMQGTILMPITTKAYMGNKRFPSSIMINNKSVAERSKGFVVIVVKIFGGLQISVAKFIVHYWGRKSTIA